MYRFRIKQPFRPDFASYHAMR